MIDTSPEALAKLKARPATIHRLFDGDFVVALLDALEEARDERDEARRQRDDVLDALEEAQAEIAALQSKIAYGPFKEMLPSPAHSGSGDTGEDK